MSAAPAERAPAAAGRRRLVVRLVQGVVAALIIVFIALYLRRSWGAVKGFDWRLEPGWLVLSAVALLLFYIAQALGWWLLLRGFRLESPVLTATATWAKSILGRYVPGTVVMIVGRVWMCQRQGLNVERVSAAMVYEQALGICSALTVLALLLPSWIGGHRSLALALIGIPVFIVVLHPRVFGPLADRALRLVRRAPLGTTLSFAAVLALLAYYTLTWAAAGIGCWALARSLADVGPAALPAVTAAYALAYVAGMVAFIVPSGLGVRESVLTVTLTNWLPAGVALTWALILRLWVTVVEFVFVAAAVLVDAAARRGRR